MEPAALIAGAVLAIILIIALQRRWLKRARIKVGDVEAELEAHDDRTPKRPALATVHQLSTRDEQQESPALHTPKWRNEIDLDDNEFVGRATEVDNLKEMISQGPGRAISAIRGVGGIGKTATTFEAVKSCAEDTYSMIAWSSFRPNIGVDEIKDETGTRRSAKDVLRSLTAQFGLSIDTRDDIIIDSFTSSIAKASRHENVLIIVDNLEQLVDYDMIFDVFSQRDLFRSCHLVLTTRVIRGNRTRVQEVSLKGLSLPDSCELVRNEAASSSDVATASDKTLRRLHSATEGNPYLLKLLGRQLAVGTRPLDRLLRDLDITETDGPQDSLTSRMRNYMFRSSIEQLMDAAGTQRAEALLYGFTVEPPASKISFDPLRAYTGLDEEEFQRTLQSAHELSLVTAHNLTGRYSIHSLLHRWITSIDQNP